MRPGLFSISYLGSIAWWAAVVQSKEVFLEAHENFVKQSYRNRCYIDSPNGVLMLNIPVQHGPSKKISDLKVAYQENWGAKHWQAIQTTYRNSPFFETVGPALKEVYTQKNTTLWELNLAFMLQVKAWLQLPQNISFTTEWQAQPQNMEDWRPVFHPKNKTAVCAQFPPYPQMFDLKFGFRPNLSILDLLFNEGPAAYDYLAQLEFVFSSPS